MVKTNVILFRRKALDFNLLEKYYKEVKDIFIYFMLLNHGNGIIQPWITSVYRMHAGGRWSALNRFHKVKLNHFCVRGMYESYLGEAPSLQSFYRGSLWAYFKESLVSFEWKDALKAAAENPLICFGEGVERITKKINEKAGGLVRSD